MYLHMFRQVLHFAKEISATKTVTTIEICGGGKPWANHGGGCMTDVFLRVFKWAVGAGR